MQAVDADLRLWRSIPTRLATIVMAVVAGFYTVPTGLIAAAVAFFVLCVVRRQLSWFPARPAWGFVTIIWVPLSRVAFWLSVALLLFGLWRQELNPLWGIPLLVGWRLAIMLVERSRLPLLQG